MGIEVIVTGTETGMGAAGGDLGVRLHDEATLIIKGRENGREVSLFNTLS